MPKPLHHHRLGVHAVSEPFSWYGGRNGRHTTGVKDLIINRTVLAYSTGYYPPKKKETKTRKTRKKESLRGERKTRKTLGIRKAEGWGGGGGGASENGRHI